MPMPDKYIQSLPVFELAGRYVKPYHITREPGGVLRPDIIEAAYKTAEQLASPPDDEMPPASWLILHEGKGATYLCVYDWVWGNAVEGKGAAAGEPYLGCTDSDETHFVVVTRPLVGCVWELAVLEHERAAWVRHMLTPAEADLAAYLADRPADGPVGLRAAS
jgi:hypothetical protein